MSIETRIAGRNVQVYIGDTLVTGVRRLEIEATIHGPVVTRLELICGVSYADGVVRLGGAPQHAMPVGVGRALRFQESDGP